MIAKILLLTAIIVFIVDLSGFTDSWKSALSRFTRLRIVSFKPFDCSLCLSWWGGLILLLCCHAFTLANVALVAGCSFLSRPMGDALRCVSDLITYVIAKIQNSL